MGMEIAAMAILEDMGMAILGENPA